MCTSKWKKKTIGHFLSQPPFSETINSAAAIATDSTESMGADETFSIGLSCKLCKIEFDVYFKIEEEDHHTFAFSMSVFRNCQL
jgi:hypothetical protein